MADRRALDLHKTAVHQAGHIVIGNLLGIEMCHATIADGGRSQFQPIGEKCDLRTADQREVRRWSRRYAMLSLAGMVAEIRLLEELAIRATGEAPSENVIRTWERAAMDAHPHDFDAAYEYVASGVRADNTVVVERNLNQGWDRVMIRFHDDAVWQHVKRVTIHLLKIGELTADEVTQLLSEPT